MMSHTWRGRKKGGGDTTVRLCKKKTEGGHFQISHFPFGFLVLCPDLRCTVSCEYVSALPLLTDFHIRVMSLSTFYQY
jgi:hypothetical protein